MQNKAFRKLLNMKFKSQKWIKYYFQLWCWIAERVSRYFSNYKHAYFFSFQDLGCAIFSYQLLRIFFAWLPLICLKKRQWWLLWNFSFINDWSVLIFLLYLLNSAWKLSENSIFFIFVTTLKSILIVLFLQYYQV